MLSRPLAAACAACLTTMVTYPLDTIKVWKQAQYVPVKRSKLKDLYRGTAIDLPSTFVATGLYFSAYEKYMQQNLQLATFIGIGLSGLCIVPCDIYKKGKQTEKHINKDHIKRLPYLYGIHMLKHVPKNLIKYNLYEAVRQMLIDVTSPLWCGALSGAAASVCTILIFNPIDVIKTKFILNGKLALDSTTWITLFVGIKENMLLSILNNAIGHGLLEAWGPR